MNTSLKNKQCMDDLTRWFIDMVLLGQCVHDRQSNHVFHGRNVVVCQSGSLIRNAKGMQQSKICFNRNVGGSQRPQHSLR